MNTEVIILFLVVGVLLLQIIWIATNPLKISIWQYSKKPQQLTTSFIWNSFLVLQLIGGYWFHWQITSFDVLFQITGLVCAYIGVSLAVWAKLVMKENWGIPAQHDFKRQNKLITRGPFLFTRNPIYLGLILIMLGFAISLKSYFIGLIIFPYFYFVNVIEKEEKLLEKHFGSEYRNYLRKTPRLLFR